ncbi:hypothetical protein LTR09_009004 [Extremus antarcticus]|uniref:Uncharacterized protein n=1 Tax=Extremus antarcticus TaxID=702011 RepID=A0AAJ0G5Z6_9PEZI|nr:hypothetical protein LTR09_009004 [Extremus antarcticus]
MSSSTFVIFGSGLQRPGIGVSVAKAFGEKHFVRIVLCGRNAERLETDRTQVVEAAKQVGRAVGVIAVPVDLSNRESLREALEKIGSFGVLGCVYHNAARINPVEPLSVSAEEIEEDFKTGNLALYIIAQWAIPLLKSGGHPSPSFFVTNSLLPEEPIPYLLSLSMSKASQQNMMVSLEAAFGKDIHFGLIKVGGIVAPENKYLNPTNIAKQAVQLFEQEKGAWKLQVIIKE